jgi:hypothetical protein
MVSSVPPVCLQDPSVGGGEAETMRSRLNLNELTGEWLLCSLHKPCVRLNVFGYLCQQLGSGRIQAVSDGQRLGPQQRKVGG